MQVNDRYSESSLSFYKHKDTRTSLIPGNVENKNPKTSSFQYDGQHTNKVIVTLCLLKEDMKQPTL